jgi:hypothetical protein
MVDFEQIGSPFTDDGYYYWLRGRLRVNTQGTLAIRTWYDDFPLITDGEETSYVFSENRIFVYYEFGGSNWGAMPLPFNEIVVLNLTWWLQGVNAYFRKRNMFDRFLATNDSYVSFRNMAQPKWNGLFYSEFVMNDSVVSTSLSGRQFNINTVFDDYYPPPPPPVSSIAVTPNTINLQRGRTARTRLTVSNGTTNQTKNITITSEHGLQLRAIPR